VLSLLTTVEAAKKQSRGIGGGVGVNGLREAPIARLPQARRAAYVLRLRRFDRRLASLGPLTPAKPPANTAPPCGFISLDAFKVENVRIVAHDRVVIILGHVKPAFDAYHQNPTIIARVMRANGQRVNVKRFNGVEYFAGFVPRV
jgi:hypothetical protein